MTVRHTQLHRVASAESGFGLDVRWPTLQRLAHQGGQPFNMCFKSQTAHWTDHSNPRFAIRWSRTRGRKEEANELMGPGHCFTNVPAALSTIVEPSHGAC